MNEKLSKAMEGNENGLTRGAFVKALRRKLVQNPQKLDNIIDKLLTEAESGQSWAIQELSNRLDGKSISATEISGPEGNPIEVQEAGTFAKELLAKILVKKQNETDN